MPKGLWAGTSTVAIDQHVVRRFMPRYCRQTLWHLWLSCVLTGCLWHQYVAFGQPCQTRRPKPNAARPSVISERDDGRIYFKFENITVERAAFWWWLPNKSKNEKPRRRTTIPYCTWSYALTECPVIRELGSYERFREMCCLHLQGEWWMLWIFLKHCQPRMRLHTALTQITSEHFVLLCIFVLWGLNCNRSLILITRWSDVSVWPFVYFTFPRILV